MGRRSRSRSPQPHRGVERRRSRSRDREHKRRRHRSPGKPRRRSRSFSPNRRRSRSPPGGRVKRPRVEVIGEPAGASSKYRGGGGQTPMQFSSRPEIPESELEGKSEDEIQMMKLMGFGGFDSTKGKKVPGNDGNYAANLVHKRKYRQYMNRRGGFNRPLDFIA